MNLLALVAVALASIFPHLTAAPLNFASPEPLADPLARVLLPTATQPKMRIWKDGRLVDVKNGDIVRVCPERFVEGVTILCGGDGDGGRTALSVGGEVVSAREGNFANGMAKMRDGQVLWDENVEGRNVACEDEGGGRVEVSIEYGC